MHVCKRWIRVAAFLSTGCLYGCLGQAQAALDLLLSTDSVGALSVLPSAGFGALVEVIAALR